MRMAVEFIGQQGNAIIFEIFTQSAPPRNQRLKNGRPCCRPHDATSTFTRFQDLIPAPASQKIFWALPKSGSSIQAQIGHLSNYSGTACRADRVGSFK
jgi:hypothetical protein